MENIENDSGFSLTPEEKDENIERYEKAIEDTKKEHEQVYGIGIVLEPEKGKRYLRLELPETTKKVGLTYADERGGRVLKIPNGALLEVDNKGALVNPIAQSYFEQGTFPGTLVEVPKKEIKE